MPTFYEIFEVVTGFFKVVYSVHFLCFNSVSMYVYNLWCSLQSVPVEIVLLADLEEQ